MSKLNKRSKAILLAVLVVIVGTLFGVHRSVGSESKKIEAQFYNGVYLVDEDYTQPSINAQLKKRGDAALGLVTIGSKFGDIHNIPELTNALRQSRVLLLDAKSIPDKFAANEKLQTAYRALYDALFQFDMVESALTAVKKYASVLDGAQGAIKKSDYNRMVSEFMNGTLGTFPVNTLKKLAFVKYPEYFGVEE